MDMPGSKDYSFAKYINGEMVLSTGDFPYDKTDAEYVDKIADYRIFSTDGSGMFVYKNGNATVMITRPNLTAGDIIISFAYIFAFVLLFSNLVHTDNTKACCKASKYPEFPSETSAVFYRDTIIFILADRHCRGLSDCKPILIRSIMRT